MKLKPMTLKTYPEAIEVITDNFLSAYTYDSDGVLLSAAKPDEKYFLEVPTDLIESVFILQFPSGRCCPKSVLQITGIVDGLMMAYRLHAAEAISQNAGDTVMDLGVAKALELSNLIARMMAKVSEAATRYNSKVLWSAFDQLKEAKGKAQAVLTMLQSR